MAIEDVVCDVEFAADVPVRELWAIRRVPNLVVALVELQVKVVDHPAPEPVQPRGAFALNVVDSSLMELLEVTDSVFLHERVDVTPLNELLAGLVEDFLEFL